MILHHTSKRIMGISVLEKNNIINITDYGGHFAQMDLKRFVLR